MAEKLDKPIGLTAKPTRSQEFYDSVKRKYAEERDLRLKYRPNGLSQYTSELSGTLAKYEVDTYAEAVTPRKPLNDTVECLFIGGGFSALLTSARLRQVGVESIRIVERGADVGGTWYWNRYPGVACDVVSYDYLPLLDELDYVPKDHYAGGPEIFAHCKAIAKKYNLYELATFQTTVTATVWNEAEQMWHVATDRGDQMKARFVICANGILTKPKLAKIKGLETFKGHSFHTSRWDYAYTKPDLSGLEDKVVGIIGTGATAVQAVPGLGAAAKELYVFQRTPSSIDIRDDWPTDPNWARKLINNNKPMVLVAMYPAGVIAGILVIMTNKSFAALGGLFIIAGAIVYLVGIFSIKAAMEEYYNWTEKMGLQMSGAMTFFFSTIYIQYHVNRIARWKKTGVIS